MARSSMIRPALALICAMGLGVSAAKELPEESSADPQAIIESTLRAANGLYAQGDALARLAWLDESVSPEVAALARLRLEQFGGNAMRALRTALTAVAPRHQADVVATLLAARLRLTAQIPPDYLPALEEALWFGSREAQRLAVPELCRHRYLPAFLPIIDVAYEHPALRKSILVGIPIFHNERARFFLQETLETGTREEQRLAAQALASIRGLAKTTLRDATRSDDDIVRMEAIYALLSIAEPGDLSMLETYVSLHTDDDAELLERVNEQIDRLEEYAP